MILLLYRVIVLSLATKNSLEVFAYENGRLVQLIPRDRLFESSLKLYTILTSGVVYPKFSQLVAKQVFEMSGHSN